MHPIFTTTNGLPSELLRGRALSYFKGANSFPNRSKNPHLPPSALEFSSFGKDKTGKYKGIAMHDDTVITTINLTRLYEDSVYSDKLYDLLEILPDSFVKRRINKLLEMLEVTSDIDDESFQMIYSSPDVKIQSESNLTEMFETGYQNLNRYNVKD